MQRLSRLKREVEMLRDSPPHGITCYPVEENITKFEAKILGGDGTPYNGGVFTLTIELPERYPFEPPKVLFITPIYHPNIDNAGRICLDTLRMPPKGAWKPCHNLVTVLTSVQLLMAEPNPDDALMADIATEFKHNRALFIQKAGEHTARHAVQPTIQKKYQVNDTENEPQQEASLAAKTFNSRADKRSLESHQSLSDISTKKLKS